MRRTPVGLLSAIAALLVAATPDDDGLDLVPLFDGRSPAGGLQGENGRFEWRALRIKEFPAR